MTTLSELIRTRRTIGAFTDAPVSRQIVESLLESAVYAPNHHLTQPWRFVIIDGAVDAAVDGTARQAYATIRRRIAAEVGKDPDKAYRQQLEMPLILFVVMKEVEKRHTRQEDYAASAALIQNFLLLAWEQGLGTGWKTYPEDAELNQFLGIATDETVVGIINIGYPAKVHNAAPRKAIKDKLTYIEVR